ncbi:pirin family protein [Geodermatophilus sp. URMC 64]
MTLEQDVVLTADDGSLGPLLRLADDRLAPGAGYGRHEHRAVDVVAVVVSGSVRHAWGPDARLAAGDVAVLRAGSGLEHDEVAGQEGARLLQTYLRAAEPAAAPSHAVRPQPAGWVDLGRADARLWVHRLPAGEVADVPPGLLVVAGPGTTTTHEQPGGPFRATDPALLLVWQLDRQRPDWAAF